MASGHTDLDAGFTRDQELEQEAQDHDAGPLSSTPRRVVGLTMVDRLQLTFDIALQRIADGKEQELSPDIEKIVQILSGTDFSTSGGGGQVGAGGAVTGSSSAVSSVSC